MLQTFKKLKEERRKSLKQIEDMGIEVNKYSKRLNNLNERLRNINRKLAAKKQEKIEKLTAQVRNPNWEKERREIEKAKQKEEKRQRKAKAKIKIKKGST